MCVQKLAVFIMTHQEHLGISLESRSTFAENMERRNGNVKNALNVMQFNQIGKLIPRFVALESIDVTVVLSSLGTSNYFSPSYFLSYLILLYNTAITYKYTVLAFLCVCVREREIRVLFFSNS